MVYMIQDLINMIQKVLQHQQHKAKSYLCAGTTTTTSSKSKVSSSPPRMLRKQSSMAVFMNP